MSIPGSASARSLLVDQKNDEVAPQRAARQPQPVRCGGFRPVAPDTTAILRLDTDWYESTKHELLHLSGGSFRAAF
jgi:hypothetical protein